MTGLSSKPRSVACPKCGKSVLWTPENAWRPFCSERCKLVDLGAWAAEQYRVPLVEDKDEPESRDSDTTPPASEK